MRTFWRPSEVAEAALVIETRHVEEPAALGTPPAIETLLTHRSISATHPSQLSPDIIEIALRQAFLSKQRAEHSEGLGLRCGLGLDRLDDESPTTHVYLHRGTDSKSGALKLRALQAQHGNGHRATVRSTDPVRPVIHRESPNLRALGRYLGKVAINGICAGANAGIVCVLTMVCYLQ